MWARVEQKVGNDQACLACNKQFKAANPYAYWSHLDAMADKKAETATDDMHPSKEQVKNFMWWPSR